jgi:hypothetical protein
LDNITFDEKLKLISEIYFGDKDQSIFDEDIKFFEAKIGFNLPLPLRKFYLVFGNGEKLLKCMYNIAIPAELYIENDILVFAGEYQGVCSYGINIDSQELMYIDNNTIEPVNQELEDFLLYLLAIQGTEFFHCICRISIEYADIIEKFLLRISCGDKAVYCSKDGIIGFKSGSEIIISAQNDDCMEKFENESNLELDYL